MNYEQIGSLALKKVELSFFLLYFGWTLLFSPESNFVWEFGPVDGVKSKVKWPFYPWREMKHFYNVHAYQAVYYH
jgi:hypothetical protein